ncbi:hypothetical protein Hanom_Chr07g00590961 [Helianthus anomalus]
MNCKKKKKKKMLPMHSPKSDRGSKPLVSPVSSSNRFSRAAQAAPLSFLLINFSPLRA